MQQPPYRPMQLVSETCDPQGHRMYLCPPNPGMPRGTMSQVYDWIEMPDAWGAVDSGGIQGLSVVDYALLNINFKANSEIDDFKHDWKELWWKEHGKTCILMGAGPSLQESLPEIDRFARDKKNFFTMSINRALKAYPTDYYLVLDRRGDEDWTENVDVRNTNLISCTTANLWAPRANYKERYWGEHCWTIQLPGQKPYKTQPLSKVHFMGTALVITLCDAMLAAYKLGAKQVWLYGCDFAVTGEILTAEDAMARHAARMREMGQPVRAVRNMPPMCVWLDKYYWDQSTEQAMMIRPHEGAPMPVMGINGRMVFQTWELTCYAAYTTAMAMMLERGGIPVRNRTPQGILWESWREPAEKPKPRLELVR